MRIAVTGATGFIGRHLVRVLRERGDALLLMGRDLASLEEAFGGTGEGISLVETAYDEDLHSSLKNMEGIVHLSGLRWRKEKIMKDYLSSNVVPTESLYAAAADCGIQNIVFLSSIAVYNPAVNTLPFSEREACSPGTHYGVSKLLCEKIGGYYHSQTGMKIKALRVGQVVGLEERGGFMLKDFMDKASARKALTVFGRGIGSRDYVYVLDVISAILQALENAEKAGVYNISLGRPVTNLQLAEAVNRAFGNEGNLIMDEARPEDTSCLLMTNEKAGRELGWSAQWNLDEMFADLAKSMATQDA